MTQEELNQIIQEDPYHRNHKKDKSGKEIRNPHTEYEKQRFVEDVQGICPLCGKRLLDDENKIKLYEIAHIYPYRPKKEQYQTFLDLERLGDDCESADNKIALCLDCHKKYDKPKIETEEDCQLLRKKYIKLVNIKKEHFKNNEIRNILEQHKLKEQIEKVIEEISNKLNDNNFNELNYLPVSVDKKLSNNTEKKLEIKISAYVQNYYPVIREKFSQLDGKKGFYFDVFAGKIKNFFKHIKHKTDDKSEIFEWIIEWLEKETNHLDNIDREAYEIIVSYFVQNCEIFDEITK